MITYEYEVVATGAVVEVEQRITEPAHEVLEVGGQMVSVRRLISGAPRFQLISGPAGSWGSGGYALTPAQRKAEMKLGRKVTKRA